MHPGPINRGVEIDSAVADGAQSVILPQVTFGIAVRMAVMGIVAGNSSPPESPPGGRHPLPGETGSAVPPGETLRSSGAGL
jgi:hypothetical protein